MPGQRKDVPPAGSDAGENIGFSFEELQAELRRLHDHTHKPRQPGEFTISDYAKTNDLDAKTASNQLNWLEMEGLVERPDGENNKRFIEGRMRSVFRFTEKGLALLKGLKVDQPVQSAGS